MSERLRKFISSFQYTCIFLIGLIFLAEYRLPFALAMVVCFAFNLFDFLTNKPYVPVGDFHKENDSGNNEDDAINKFVNEICGYAADRKIRPMLVNNGQEGMILQDMPEDDSTPAKVCVLTIPPENCKYGSDEYKAAVNLITEKIDEYIENRGEKND